MGRDDDDRDDDRDDDDRDDDRDDDDRDERAEAGAGRQHRPWLWAVTSTIVILIGLGMLAAYPGASREARRYHDADRCERPTDPPSCVEVVPAVVERTRKEGFRRPDYYVDLRVGEGATFRPTRQPVGVEVEDTGKVYDSLEPGDRVHVTYWGPAITRITKPGVGAVETISSPSFDAGVTLGLGPILPVVGGLGLRFAIRLRQRTGSWTQKGAVLRSAKPFRAIVGMFALFGVVIGSLVISGGSTFRVGDAVATWALTGGAGALLGVAAGGIAAAVREARGR